MLWDFLLYGGCPGLVIYILFCFNVVFVVLVHECTSEKLRFLELYKSTALVFYFIQLFCLQLHIHINRNASHLIHHRRRRSTLESTNGGSNPLHPHPTTNNKPSNQPTKPTKCRKKMVQKNITVAIIIIVLFILLSIAAFMIWAMKNHVLFFSKKKPADEESTEGEEER